MIIFSGLPTFLEKVIGNNDIENTLETGDQPLTVYEELASNVLLLSSPESSEEREKTERLTSTSERTAEFSDKEKTIVDPDWDTISDKWPD